MPTVARNKNTGKTSETVRALCDAFVEGGNDGVVVMTDVTGGAGFGLFERQSGNFEIVGEKMANGRYPVIRSEGIHPEKSDPNRLTFGKAIYNAEGGNCRFGNLVLTGAQVNLPDGNGAGIRINTNVKSFHGFNFAVLDCQDGILTDGKDGQELTFEDFVLSLNGYGRQGYTHNIYAGYGSVLTLRRGTVAKSPYGHDLKSRFLKTVIEQVHAEGSAKGRALDVSQGGIVVSSNSAYIKYADGGQGNLVHIGAEIKEKGDGGREHAYESTNDFFRNDISISSGRGIELIKNEGYAPMYLIDPLFMVGGKILSYDEAKRFLVGDIRIGYTGGPLGPRKPVGCQGDIIKQISGLIAPFSTPAHTAPAPVQIIRDLPEPPDADGATWKQIAQEFKEFTIEDNTIVRYGLPGKWVTKLVPMGGKYLAGNEFFGSDPAPGQAKIVQKRIPADVAPPKAEPAPTPEPQPAPTPTPIPTPAPVPGPTPAAIVSGFLNTTGSYDLSIDAPAGVFKSLTLTAK